MRRSLISDKINNFLKPVLNISILSNLAAACVEDVIKKRAGILHQIHTFRESINSWGE